jgi:thioredoxin 1
MSNLVTELKENEFQKAVFESDLPVLVDFFAPWCGPCRALAPALEQIAKAYEGRLKVVKVNVDEAPGLAAQFRVRSIPTLLIVKNGAVADTMVGVPPGGELKQKLDAVAA